MINIMCRINIVNTNFQSQVNEAVGMSVYNLQEGIMNGFFYILFEHFTITLFILITTYYFLIFITYIIFKIINIFLVFIMLPFIIIKILNQPKLLSQDYFLNSTFNQ